jgi:FixJ family two-component response regulator
MSGAADSAGLVDACARACVCVLDDDAEVRSAIGSLLRASGHDVALFGSTAEFLAAGLPEVPACLVLDIRLPGESGLDFQERLAAEGLVIPVILITGHGDIPMTVRAMRAGAVDFLPKPFDEGQLLAAIDAALATDRARRAAQDGDATLQAAHASLTPREAEVMALVVTGLMNKQVAARLTLSEITVKIHRGNVMRKMQAQSLADLVRMAERLGVRDATIHRYNTSV